MTCQGMEIKEEEHQCSQWRNHRWLRETHRGNFVEGLCYINSN